MQLWYRHASQETRSLLLRYTGYHVIVPDSNGPSADAKETLSLLLRHTGYHVIVLYSNGPSAGTKETLSLLLRHAVPRDRYLGSPVARWLLPGNEL
jgi:hypothetical protein